MRRNHKQPLIYEWTPGVGPDPATLLKMMDAFPRPKAPMGEAWFMSSSRKMYTEVIERPLPEVDLDYLVHMLDEITSGPTCFGEMEEWTEWFHFLLPRMTQGAVKSMLLDTPQERLACAMFSQHPDDNRDDPYKHFTDDVLATLGLGLMAPELWNDGMLRRGTPLLCTSRYYNRDKWWHLHRAHPAFSATLFLCMKYLRPSQIHSWWASVCAIECPIWRGQISIWLLGARAFLEGAVSQPKEFDSLQPEINWGWSHCLGGHFTGDYSEATKLVDEKGRQLITHKKENLIPFVTDINRLAFVEACKSLLPRHVREDWCQQMNDEPLLVNEMGTYIDEFAALDFRTSGQVLITP